MDFKNRTFFASLAAALGVVIVAGLGIVALGAQQGPPPGRGPGGQGGPGMHGGGMFGGPGGPGGQGPGMRGGPGGRGPMAGMMMRDLGQLDLTDDQKAQIKAVHESESNKAANQDIAKKMIAAREALDSAVTADPFDEGTIRAAAVEVAKIEADAAVLRAQVHATVFGLLTPEQKAKAKQLRGQAKLRMDQMGGPGMGRGMGRGGRGPGGPEGRNDREVVGGWF